MTTIDDLMLMAQQRSPWPTPSTTLRAALETFAAEQREAGALAERERCVVWVPAHERVPAPGTDCVVLLRYTLDRPPFVSIDRWDVQHEDPLGMGGPTIETGVGWNDNEENDVIAWFAVPALPPEEWDQRLPAEDVRSPDPTA